MSLQIKRSVSYALSIFFILTTVAGCTSKQTGPGSETTGPPPNPDYSALCASLNSQETLSQILGGEQFARNELGCHAVWTSPDGQDAEGIQADVEASWSSRNPQIPATQLAQLLLDEYHKFSHLRLLQIQPFPIVTWTRYPTANDTYSMELYGLACTPTGYSASFSLTRQLSSSEDPTELLDAVDSYHVALEEIATVITETLKDL